MGQDSQYLVPGHVFGPRVSVKTQVKKLRGDNAHHIVEAGGCGSRYGRDMRGTSLFFTASSSILEHVSTGLEAGFC